MSTASRVSRIDRRRRRRRAALTVAAAVVAVCADTARSQEIAAPAPEFGPAVAAPTAAYASPRALSAPLMPTPPPAYTEADEARLRPRVWRRWKKRREHQEKWLGYPEEFNEWPLGYALYGNMIPQVANAAAVRMAFYDYDFVPGTAQLTVRGRDKLVAIAAALPTSFAPVHIERTPYEPGLAERRQAAIVEELAAGRFPVPPERVVIGPRPTQGLRGEEAVFINTNQLNQTQQGGAIEGGGGAGGFDASGLTAPAIGGTGLGGTGR